MLWIDQIYLTILCYKDVQIIYRFFFTVLSRDIENTFPWTKESCEGKFLMSWWAPIRDFGFTFLISVISSSVKCLVL